MPTEKGFSWVIVVAIVAVVLVGGGIAAFLYITSTTNPQTQSSAYTPTQLNVKLPQPDSGTGFKPPETATPSPAAPATPATTSAAPASNYQPSAIAAGQVNVSSALSADKKTFTVDFLSSTNFSGINLITYNLTYTADSGNKGIQGTFNITGSSITTNSFGQQDIQKALTLGTCSSGTCIYDANPKNFRLSVSTK